MAQAGKLVQWNDERGFGFIVADSGERVFVHATAFARMVNRPRAGDSVKFQKRVGRDGRLEARSVSVVGANPIERRRIRRAASGYPARSDWRLPLAVVLIIVMLVGIALGRIPYFVPLLYGVMGGVCLGLYRADKHFAETGQWRISEVMLLSADLCFGIVGALVAQALFRHKTRKQGYVATTILFAGIHLVWLAGLASGLIAISDILALPALFTGS